MFDLSTPVINLNMIGPVAAERLKKIGIHTISDLIYHYPFRYIDYSNTSSISKLQIGETVSLLCKIQSIQNIYTRTGKRFQKALVSDNTGLLQIMWYNQPYLINVLKPGLKISLSGKATFLGSKPALESPDYEIYDSSKELIHTGRIIPVYPESEGVSSKWIRSRIYPLLFRFNLKLSDILPDKLNEEHNLISLKDALIKIHFPANMSAVTEAKRKLSFNEMFLLQLIVQKRRLAQRKQKASHILKIKSHMKEINSMVGNLPFTLTLSQKTALSDILVDLEKSTPMNRMLEGDVGSGKTVIAAIAGYAVYLNGKKTVIMAPTEILANQHFQTMTKLLKNYNIKIGLFTSSHKSPFETDIMIGTHALLNNKLNFKKVSLVVIDEQQRFGVKQRALLRQKNKKPHLLTMTATPIPRTIALTLFADLDLSILNQNPSGRKKIKSWVVPSYKREAAYNWIRNEITNSGYKIQAIIVCPFIEESESAETVKAAKAEFQKLKGEVFPQMKIGLLQGKMKSNEKSLILEKLKKNDINILVSTPIIEVGIDIPTLTIMLIEGADRFGLAQLHQLRGRVGRGKTQSYCLLFSESDNQKSIERLKFLESINNGPQLADIDFQLRGAGQLYGLKQHGRLKELKIASLTDISLISQTKTAAQNLLVDDPDLWKYEDLRNYVQNYTIEDVSED